MSKPIYEPTPARADAELGYGRDQLFRRPAPLSVAAGPPCFLATRKTALTVPSDNETPITFGEWSNSDSSIFLETLFGGALQKVTFLLPGIYSINVGYIWATPFFYEAHAILVLDDSTAGSDWFDTTSMGSYQGQTGDEFTYSHTFGVTRSYPVEPTATGYSAGVGGVGRLFFKANQHSGTNKALDGAWVNIYYLGDCPVSMGS